MWHPHRTALVWCVCAIQFESIATFAGYARGTYWQRQRQHYLPGEVLRGMVTVKVVRIQMPGSQKFPEGAAGTVSAVRHVNIMGFKGAFLCSSP